MDILYAALGGANGTSDLYTVDPATGAVTSIGPIGYGLTGLAWDPVGEVLYGSTNLNSASNPGWLISIDPTTGAGTPIGKFAIHPSFTFADLACDPSGNLYGLNPNNLSELWLINKATGGGTVIGSMFASGSATSGNGLDFSPLDGELYAFPRLDDGHVYTVSTSTGVGTVGAALDGASHKAINAASFDAAGTLYAVRNNSPSQLVTIDVGTGHVSSIGGMGAANFDALAWKAAPATPPPVADFSATPVEGPAPLTVAFTDLSTNTPTSWAWGFGDGGTSTAQNPSHVYTLPGVYDVSLTATNGSGSGTTTKTGYIAVSSSPATSNDRVAAIVELPYVTDDSDYLDGTRPGPFVPIVHAGALVVADLATGAAVGVENRDIKVRRFNGTSWDDLGFPTTRSFASLLDLGPLPREGFHSMASDGETLWLSLIVDETLDGAYLDPIGIPAGTFFWKVGSTYVFAWDGAAWTLVYYRKGATLNRPTTGALASAPGGISHMIGSHPGAGYAWECSIESGNRGGTLADPFTNCLAISAKLDDAGVLSETFGLNYGDTGRPSLYTGPYYGSDQPEDGTADGNSKVAALVTDAGFPVYVSGVYLATTSAVRADTFAQLQHIDDYTLDDSSFVHDGLIYLGMATSDGNVSALFYGEEVGSAGSSRAVVYTLPVDGSTGFEPLVDRYVEDVSLVKKPLEALGPATFGGELSWVAAVTGLHRPWVPLNFEAAAGNEYIGLFVLNDGCPYESAMHGRYRWDYAVDSVGSHALITPARFGDSGIVFDSGYWPVYDADSGHLYVLAWAEDSALGGDHFLRCWYWRLCRGCLACDGSSPEGLHIWQKF